ncbi:MAG: L-seryl-tRNA(Sec) selenium transferase, partial [Thermovirgaceae bacterium]|nr:L-seryl-tRNA(Sec) selenium transferase [Thermovirgaceae bacterium]
MQNNVRDMLRDIPSMDELLLRSWTFEFQSKLGRDAVKATFADVIGETRKAMIQGSLSSFEVEKLESEVLIRLRHYASKSFC